MRVAELIRNCAELGCGTVTPHTPYVLLFRSSAEPALRWEGGMGRAAMNATHNHYQEFDR